MQWFTILKVPILKLVVGDQTLHFAPVSCDLWEREFPYRCLRLAEQRVCEVTHYARVRLFDYFSGAELPIREEVRYIEYALPGMRMRAWHTLIIHKVLLEDPQWRKEKVVRGRGLLEVCSARGEVQRDPERSLFYQEWVELNCRKFVRSIGMFSTANDPFVCEEVVE